MRWCEERAVGQGTAPGGQRGGGTRTAVAGTARCRPLLHDTHSGARMCVQKSRDRATSSVDGLNSPHIARIRTKTHPGDPHEGILRIPRLARHPYGPIRGHYGKA